ncbi:uncharacterized protein LOC144572351 isoform X5 [Carex rostrata]
MVQINICFYLLKAMGVLADSLSIALEMSEESSSGNSIIQSKAIPNRKRKETKAVPDPSIVEEDILVHSDHSMSSHSARTTLVRNLDESPFRARVTGNDGTRWVSESAFLFALYCEFKSFAEQHRRDVQLVEFLAAHLFFFSLAI